jgi:hypothetical protein
MEPVDPADKAPPEQNYPGMGHALLLIEDPATGRYCFGDSGSRGTPYLGPHPGNLVMETAILPKDLPMQLPTGEHVIPRRGNDYTSALPGILAKKNTSLSYTGSSRVGKEKAKYEAWLKNSPADFREFAAKFNTQPPPPREDYLPVLTRESTDPSLPGTWHILDRSQPITKLVDRESLAKVGAKTLVMFGKRRTVELEGPAPQFAMLFDLPADVGNEQFLLGCLPSVQDKEGKEIPHEFHYFQLKGYGNLYGEIIIKDCPAEFSVSLKQIVLLPPVLSRAQADAMTTSVSNRLSGNKKEWKDAPGFPQPEFKEGGPGFLNVTPAKNYFWTIYNVMRTTRESIKPSFDPKFTNDADSEFFDPDVIKKTKQGSCNQCARLAEKALANVARARFAKVFWDCQDPKDAVAGTPARADGYPGSIHALLLIEDPASGKYFVGDPGRRFPYLGPHPGDTVIESALLGEDYKTLQVPSRIRWPAGTLSRTNTHKSLTPVAVKRSVPLTCEASSRCGKDAAQYQTWLKNVPADFKELADKLGR